LIFESIFVLGTRPDKSGHDFRDKKQQNVRIETTKTVSSC
jgi:hypothetical protein